MGQFCVDAMGSISMGSTSATSGVVFPTAAPVVVPPKKYLALGRVKAPALVRPVSSVAQSRPAAVPVVLKLAPPQPVAQKRPAAVPVILKPARPVAEARPAAVPVVLAPAPPAAVPSDSGALPLSSGTGGGSGAGGGGALSLSPKPAESVEAAEPGATGSAPTSTAFYVVAGVAALATAFGVYMVIR